MVLLAQISRGGHQLQVKHMGKQQKTKAQPTIHHLLKVLGCHHFQQLSTYAGLWPKPPSIVPAYCNRLTAWTLESPLGSCF